MAIYMYKHRFKTSSTLTSRGQAKPKFTWRFNESWNETLSGYMDHMTKMAAIGPCDDPRLTYLTYFTESRSY